MSGFAEEHPNNHETGDLCVSGRHFVCLLVCLLSAGRARWDPEDQSSLYKDECVSTAHRADPHSAQVITLFSFNLFTVRVREVFPKKGTKHTQPCLEVSYWLAPKLLQFIFLLHLIELLSDAIQFVICLRVSKQIPRCSALCLYNSPPPPQAPFLIAGCEKTIGLIKEVRR